jgi:hypothetical protein
MASRSWEQSGEVDVWMFRTAMYGHGRSACSSGRIRHGHARVVDKTDRRGHGNGPDGRCGGLAPRATGAQRLAGNDGSPHHKCLRHRRRRPRGTVPRSCRRPCDHRGDPARTAAPARRRRPPERRRPRGTAAATRPDYGRAAPGRPCDQPYRGRGTGRTVTGRTGEQRPRVRIVRAEVPGIANRNDEATAVGSPGAVQRPESPLGDGAARRGQRRRPPAPTTASPMATAHADEEGL